MKRIGYSVVLLLLSMLVTGCLGGAFRMQGNVIGEVFYSDSRTPVIGAEVRIGGNATYTDLNGRFALSNVGVGTYNLEILHYRIEPLSMQVTVELIAM